MCLDSACKTYKKPLREKRIGYKIKDCEHYNPEDYRYQNSDSVDELELDNNGKEYEPGFHIICSKKAALKLAKSDPSNLVVFEVEYNDIIAEGYENCDNICEYSSGRCKCDIARKMKVLKIVYQGITHI